MLRSNLKLAAMQRSPPSFKLSRLDRIRRVDQVMESSDSIARLCEVCSKLDIERFTHPLHPCRNPLPCSTPPIKGAYNFLALGSIDEIKDRRLTCDICKLIAESLDKEPSDLDGECSMLESGQVCNFQLPRDVKARDPNITHFHLTQIYVNLDLPKANRFYGPSLPWEVKAKVRDGRSSNYIQIFQVSQNWNSNNLMLNS